MDPTWNWTRQVNSATSTTRLWWAVGPCPAIQSRRSFPSGSARRGCPSAVNGSPSMAKVSTMKWSWRPGRIWWRRCCCTAELALPVNTSARRRVPDRQPPSGSSLQVFWIFFWFFFDFFEFFLNFFNNIFTDVADGFELKMNVSGNPVTAEPFGLHCGVSLYNYTTDIAWFLTSSAGISRRIGNATVLPGADFSKKKNGMDLAMGCFNFVSLVAGMSMSYPNRTYSYVEMLNWSKIPKSAGGKYACQATSLDGVKINQTVSFTVQSISLAWLKTKNWIIDNNWTDRRALMIYNVTRANVEVEKGNEILLFCHATGLPVPRSKWLKVLRDPMIQVFDDFDWFWVCRTVLK